MNKSFLKYYETELLGLVPSRVIPRKQPPKLRELLAKIERIAKNHSMDLTTYLLVIGFRFEDSIQKELKRNERTLPFLEGLAELYPHKHVYALAKKDVKLCQKINYHVLKHQPKYTLNGYLISLGYTIIRGRTLTKLLLALDNIAVHRILVYLPLNTEVNDLLNYYLSKQKDIQAKELLRKFHYKLYENLSIQDLEGFTEDMLADVVQKAFPQMYIKNIADIPPAIPMRLQALQATEKLVFSDWLTKRGYSI